VFGFRPTGTGSQVEVKGQDVDAWVEVKFDGYGWTPFYPTPKKNRVPQEKPKPKPKEEDLAQQPPQNEQQLEMPEVTPDLSRKTTPPPPPKGPGWSFSIPTPVKYALIAIGIPLGLFGIYAGIVLGLKRLRRKHRRERGTLVQRASGAWAEAVDSARDNGGRWPRNLTRSELARQVSPTTWGSAPSFATTVDTLMFGRNEPTPEAIGVLWKQSDIERASMSEGLDWRGRWKARLSTRSLRPL
jgi:hypothetical protein